MPESSADLLCRLLELMAMASGPEGLALSEAEARLERSSEELLDDLQLIVTREDYHPAGWVDDVRIEIESHRVRVTSSRKFDRPPALSPREALALRLALQAAAVQLTRSERRGLMDLAARLEVGIASGTASEFNPRLSLEEGGDPDGFRTLLEQAIAERTTCRVRYLRSEDPDPTERSVDPYRLAYGNGVWYLIGYCHRGSEVRVFRLDRMIAVEASLTRFDPPEDLDYGSFVEGGRVFSATETVPVVVRYSASVSDWVRERGPVQEEPDGSVIVEFPLADTSWIVRHVLMHAPDAVVVEPPGVRDEVEHALRRQIT
jgi:proteasome accessory factor C